MVEVQGEYWRMLPFIAKTISLDVLTTTKKAYEAAKQFVKLSSLLNNFDTRALEPNIVGFHDLVLRFEQFTESLHHTSKALKE